MKISKYVIIVGLVIFSCSGFINIVNCQGFALGFRENWSFNTFYPIKSDPLMIDIDLDSNDEIIFTAYNNLYILNNYGELLKFFDGHPFKGESFVSAADLFFNDELEIFFSIGPRLFVLDHNGLNRWTYTFPDYVTSKAIIADINNDLYQEILVTCDDGKVYCLNHLGEQLWNLTLSSKLYSDIQITDFEQDGFKEIIVGGGVFNDNLFCINYDGSIRWEQLVGEVYEPVLADLDNDNIMEIIAAITQGKVVVLNSTGNILWSYYSLYTPKKPTISDINGDGELEILFFVFHSYSHEELICLSANGIQLWNKTEMDVSCDDIAVMDIDNDESPEILYGTVTKGLVCLDNSSKLKTSFKKDNTFPVKKLIAFDYLNDSKMDILYTSSLEISSFRLYNKRIFYGAYLLPVYVGSVGFIIGVLYIINRGIKTGKIKIKPKTYKYINEDGKEIYFEK